MSAGDSANQARQRVSMVTRRHRKSRHGFAAASIKMAKFKTRVRTGPEASGAKLADRYRETKRIRSTPRKAAALDDVAARLVTQIGAQAGTLKLKDYEAMREVMLPDAALPRRVRKNP
jgi:hypothetical protein